ncbi:MAG: hypothetical protein WCK58_10240 [Chloroflexota bacterium]
MTIRTRRWAVLAAAAAVLLLAPVAVADTCCANTPVTPDSAAAMPGDQVRLTGLRCLNADNSGGLGLEVRGFWLWPGHRAAEQDPATAPGPGLPQDLPPVEAWLPFDSVEGGGQPVGSAVITIPNLRDGSYQLWWRCDNGGGPGSGIHYSTGPRLRIGAVPETATVPASPPADQTGWNWAPLLLPAIGSTTFAGLLRFGPGRRRRGG